MSVRSKLIDCGGPSGPPLGGPRSPPARGPSGLGPSCLGPRSTPILGPSGLGPRSPSGGGPRSPPGLGPSVLGPRWPSGGGPSLEGKNISRRMTSLVFGSIHISIRSAGFRLAFSLGEFASAG